MEIIIYVAIALVALLVGAGVTMAINKSLAKSRANSIIEEAKLEAEVLKKNKILEAKEEGVAIKAEAEKIATQRLSKVQSTEAKLKQREMQLNQQQSEVQRKKNENESLKQTLEKEQAYLESQRQELEKMQARVKETLELQCVCLRCPPAGK